MSGLKDEQIIKVIASLHEDPNWTRQLIRQYTKENIGNDSIDTSLYSWQYPCGAAELVNEMSIDNLRQALCGCINFVEEIQNREANQGDIDDWMAGSYPGPKYIKPNPLGVMVKQTLASDQAAQRSGWSDKEMEPYWDKTKCGR